jgi:anti-sigma factor ChrR (cupin superfamily)
MNPAMNVRDQHEMHPDAETLSAFTEQALNSKERGQVLEHLAACGRCRQVVALARSRRCRS